MGQDKAPERDIYECANQLGGYIGPTTDEGLARFLRRESDAAAVLADEIVRLRSALSQAYERGQESMRERAAVAASGNSHTFDFQRALAECRDSEYGHMSARVEVAKAIRSLPIEQEEVKG